MNEWIDKVIYKKRYKLFINRLSVSLCKFSAELAEMQAVITLQDVI